MQGLVLYSGSHCPACVQADRWLTQNGFHFQKVDVNGNPQLIQWLEQQTRQRTIPQFFYNGSWLPGGFPDVQRLAQQGRLA